MGFLTSLFNSIQANPPLITLLGGLLVGFVFYRLSEIQKRNALINSLNQELIWHSSWMVAQYPDGVVKDKSWLDSGYVVFKLSTTAMDTAISQGANLFLDKKIISDLTVYSQRVTSFNQLVDTAMLFQSNSKLWVNKKLLDKDLVKRMGFLTCQIHWYGIGDSSNPNSGNNSFIRVHTALEQEKRFNLSVIFWAVTGINITFIRKLV